MQVVRRAHRHPGAQPCRRKGGPRHQACRDKPAPDRRFGLWGRHRETLAWGAYGRMSPNRTDLGPRTWLRCAGGLLPLRLEFLGPPGTGPVVDRTGLGPQPQASDPVTTALPVPGTTPT